jgi:single-stranded DNA-specific DHH superfamily exonuclease
MTGRKRTDVIGSQIKKVTDELFAPKEAYEQKAEELKALEDEKRMLQAQMIIEAMDKKGKTFEEVLNLIGL